MTWHRKVVVRILLLVAEMIEDDLKIKQEIHSIATHISVNAPAEVPRGA